MVGMLFWGNRRPLLRLRRVQEGAGSEVGRLAPAPAAVEIISTGSHTNTLTHKQSPQPMRNPLESSESSLM